MPSNNIQQQSGQSVKNPCGQCAKNKYAGPCPGHLSSGGGSSSDDSSNEQKPNKENMPLSMPTTQSADSAVNSIVPADNNQSWAQQLSAKHGSNAEMSFENIAHLFSFDANRALGLLTFTGNAKLTPEEQAILNRFLYTVRAEFGAFKADLAGQGVNVRNFTATFKNNVLDIHIPSAKHYAAFVQQLAHKKLLPPALLAKPAVAEESEQNDNEPVAKRNTAKHSSFSLRPRSPRLGY